MKKVCAALTVGQLKNAADVFDLPYKSSCKKDEIVNVVATIPPARMISIIKMYSAKDLQRIARILGINNNLGQQHIINSIEKIFETKEEDPEEVYDSLPVVCDSPPEYSTPPQSTGMPKMPYSTTDIPPPPPTISLSQEELLKIILQKVTNIESILYKQ